MTGKCIIYKDNSVAIGNKYGTHFKKFPTSKLDYLLNSG